MDEARFATDYRDNRPGRMMDRIAQVSPRERANLFQETAGLRPGIPAFIIEKDFWVCWALKHIFMSIELMSRHYYDLYCLSKTEIGSRALKETDLLKRVIEHKLVFFRSAWAHYETAVSGSFRLIPSAGRIQSLRNDYAEMKAMIFGESPEWNIILEGLKDLEDRINGN